MFLHNMHERHDVSCPRQVAANNRGIQLVGALIKEYGLDVVHAYMTFIQARTQPRPTGPSHAVWG